MSISANKSGESGGEGARVVVCIADHHGWDIRVELDGRLVAVEHCGDWHRVERRRTRLEGQLAANGGMPTNLPSLSAQGG